VSPQLRVAMPSAVETYERSLMRLLTLAVLACCLGEVNVAAQCPGQVRQALFNKERKSATIRYYNADTRAAKEVQFVLSLQEPASNGQMVLGSFSAKGIVRPRQERTLVFPLNPDVALKGPMELEIKRILFVDGDAWNGPHDTRCKMAVQETMRSDAVR
jgi:hypothetical protein